MSEGDISTDSETEREVKELNGEKKGKERTGSATSRAESIITEGAKQNEAEKSDDTETQPLHVEPELEHPAFAL